MRKVLSAIIFLFPVIACAQRYYGIGTSNWSGTNSIYLNPANVADSRHRFTIDLFSFNLGVDNDKATLGSSKLFKGDSLNVGSLLQFKGDTKSFNLTAPYVELRGPGFMYSINKKSGIALTTRVRLYNQFQDFDRKLYGIIADESYRNSSGDVDVNAGKFNWNLHAWTEIGGTYGRVLMDKGKHMLKAGATVRYLGGVSYVNLLANSLAGHYYRGKDSMYIAQSDVHFASNVIKSEEQVSNGLSGGDVAN